MLDFDIRQVVRSTTGRRVLLGAFSDQVIVHDLASGVQSDPMSVDFDAGGRRIALSDQLDLVLSAAYHVHGVAAFSAATDLEVWRRKDIKKVQRLTLSPDGHTAYCGIQSSSLVILDARTGETMRKVRGAHYLIQSDIDPVSFVDATEPHIIDRAGHRSCKIERATFAFLDVAFSPGRVCTSESGGPVRCLDIGSGLELWRYEPQGGHALRIAYDPAHMRLLAAQRALVRGGNSFLVQLAIADGSVVDQHDIGDFSDCDFAMSGSMLVMSDGRVLDTNTAQQIAVIS